MRMIRNPSSTSLLMAQQLFTSQYVTTNHANVDTTYSILCQNPKIGGEKCKQFFQ